MTLRNVIIALCALIVAGAIVQSVFAWAGWMAVGIEAAVVIALLVFERSRYKPRVDSSASGWQPTGERFEDATSGKTMQVFENPATGERDYRPTN